MKKYKCPCCGFYTFESDFEYGPLFEYCDVCAWQYDPVAHEYPDRVIGANHISLNDARENYKRMGVSKERQKDCVRPPLEEELPENNI